MPFLIWLPDGWAVAICRGEPPTHTGDIGPPLSLVISANSAQSRRLCTEKCVRLRGQRLRLRTVTAASGSPVGIYGLHWAPDTGAGTDVPRRLRWRRGTPTLRARSSMRDVRSLLHPEVFGVDSRGDTDELTCQVCGKGCPLAQRGKRRAEAPRASAGSSIEDGGSLRL